ncbi:MAG TPA: small ribosomal subunit Rsm22 family protein [Opitutus sp.]|nr:small ribosomal subunit Rsm22 family protein [Opitutus sp.]
MAQQLALMTWSDLDWPALDRLRDKFLRAESTATPYWESSADLASYDFTYGERIGWKWDHVLRELRLRGWRPASRHVLDWGCGSGIAARRVIESFGAGNFDSLTVWDHSPLAADFAATAAQRKFPHLAVSQATPGLFTQNPELKTQNLGLLLISHVLNELPPDALDALRAFAAHADEILWVEPGTHAVSRALGTQRELFRAAGFRVIAPCTHENECPMFALGRERDWCHFFAPPPSEIFADSNWVKFGQRAGIDLRSLPYAFLALEKLRPVGRASLSAVVLAKAECPPSEFPDAGGKSRPAETLSRIIGRPEHFKPYARFLNCDATGLGELELPKRADPALFKELERTKSPLVYRWRRDGDKILGGEALR